MEQDTQTKILTMLSSSAVDAARFAANAKQARAVGAGDLAKTWDRLACFSRSHAEIWMGLFASSSPLKELELTIDCLEARKRRLDHERTSLLGGMIERYQVALDGMLAQLRSELSVERKREEGAFLPETEWQCEECGFVVSGKRAPTVCPLCARPSTWQKG